MSKPHHDLPDNRFLASPRTLLGRALERVFTLPLVAQVNAEPAPGDYRVVGGQVDVGTYAGWRLFHTTCYACHGVDAVGTDVAPSLVERVKTLTPRALATKVLTSYRVVPPADHLDTQDLIAGREAMIENVIRRERGARSEAIMPAGKRTARSTRTCSIRMPTSWHAATVSWDWASRGC